MFKVIKIIIVHQTADGPQSYLFIFILYFYLFNLFIWYMLSQ